MRIAFLIPNCCLGADGVADYTHLLALDCTAKGVPCAIIGINDPGVMEPTTSFVSAGSVELPLLRVPSTMSWDDRVGVAQQFLTTQRPDWVSFQFVSYGYNSAGNVSGIWKYFLPIIGKHRLHVMMHELWLGAFPREPIKHNLLGIFQRRNILKLIEVLNPRVIHTTSTYLKHVLRNTGLNAERLPLYGGVPKIAEQADSWLISELQAHGVMTALPEVTPDRELKRLYICAIFGAAAGLKQWNAHQMLEVLSDFCQHQNRRCVIVTIGKSRASKQDLEIWAQLKAEYQNRIWFVQLGQRSSTEVSQFLNSADCGLTVHEYLGIERSAAIHAFLEHGLPVIINRGLEGRARFGILDIERNFPALIHVVDDQLAGKMRSGEFRKVPPMALRPPVVEQFLASLRDYQ